MRRKGDWDLAIASYDQALAIEPKYMSPTTDGAMDNFNKGDFPAAAADFLHSIEIRDDATRCFGAICVRARAGAGADALAELAASAARLQSKVWPYAVITLYLGQRPAAELLAEAKGEERCTAQFYLGQWYVLHRNHAQAVAALRVASQTCPKTMVQYDTALVELKRLHQ